jgi:sulfate transport system substrate-binding protein
VTAGQPADLVFLSTGDDVNQLVDAGLVDQSWDEQGYDGIAANTVVVFAVRDGNPKHIKGWADLVKPGVQVVTPNPFSSGSAKWNVLAAYLAQRHLGKTDAQAVAYVQKLFKHVVSQDTSGSNATNTFLSGKGDVLITYESEAINARLQGQNIQYVIPRQTMLIQLPIAVMKNSANKDVANQFIQYVKSAPAQQLFAQYGFRPVNKTVAKKPSVVKEFPARPGIYTVSDKTIGGWRAADKRWFNVSGGLMEKIEQAVGGPTSG